MENFEKNEEVPSCKVRLYPHMDETEQNHVAALFECKYPENYPDELPEMNVSNLKALNQEQIEELNRMCLELGNENLGTAMVFTITSELTEWLCDNNIPENASIIARQKYERKIQEKIASFQVKESGNWHSIQDDNKLKQVDLGTPVTEERFLEWNEKFVEEMRNMKNQSLVREAAEIASRPTGRQIFEKRAMEQAADINAVVDEFAKSQEQSIEYDDE